MDDAKMERELTAALYRLDCPDGTELGEFHLNFLAAPRRRAIAQHLEVCPHCAQELAQLQSFLAELAPDLGQGAYKPLRVWVARLVSQLSAGNGGNSWQPAFAVRGGDFPPLVYEAGDAQVVVEVQNDASPGHKLLVGLVLGVEPEGLIADLWRGEEMIQRVEVDELGNFILNNIAPGRYELVVRSSELEIHIPSLDV